MNTATNSAVMPNGAHALNPLTLAIRGSVLIEASAGTGKTYTIASLYLRLVLGVGDLPTGPDGATPRRFEPREILVMTFTRAATRELSERIRKRLLEAAQALRAPMDVAPKDGFLAGLLQHFDTPSARKRAAWRLQAAAQSMDEAAIFTIDSWCQRMLSEHAFDSGSTLREAELAAEERLLQESCRDYWRVQVYPLQDQAAAMAVAVLKSPDGIQKSVAPLIPLELAEAGWSEPLATLIDQQLRPFEDLKHGWLERIQGLRTWALAELEKTNPALNKITLKSCAESYHKALLQWVTQPGVFKPGLDESACLNLTRAGIEQKLKKGCTLPPLPEFFDHFEGLLDAWRGLPEPEPALRLHAAQWVRHRLSELKARTQTLGFNDRLQHLCTALDPALSGERSQRLRQRILEQYPVALIDEFQDTAPTQLRVFDLLYGIAANAPERGLLLIGDPKQAIYGFRGADIHCYLQARQATAGRHQVLNTNHRSSQALVEVVNRWFGQAEQRRGPAAGTTPAPGAFLMGSHQLPFHPVQAKGREEVLMEDGAPLPAAELNHCDRALNKEKLLPFFAQCAAERIVQLLNKPSVEFQGPRGPQRLVPSDVAVLVRDFTEARAIRRALQQRGVASVYLSEKDSVLLSTQAEDLLCLLRVLCQERAPAQLRQAMATRLMARSLDELITLADEENALATVSEQFEQLWQAWQRHGILAMLRQLVFRFELASRWLREAEGERCLTNVQHLGEWLQGLATQGKGPQALVNELHALIQDAHCSADEGRGEERLLRLESDAGLVQVITVHKSKGLEYPLVFLPFGTLFKARTKANTSFVARRQGHGQHEWVLEPSDADMALADTERLQEDLRLLYVALTRARHHLWVGAPLWRNGVSKDKTLWHQSALGRLFTGEADPGEGPPFVHSLQAAAQAPGVRLNNLSPWLQQPLPRSRLLSNPYVAPLLPPQVYADDQIDRRWGLSSYSALVKGHSRSAGHTQVLREDEALEAPAAAYPSAGPPGAQAEATAGPRAPAGSGTPPSAGAPWHRFPKGPLPGNFLHDQLEWLAGEQFAFGEAQQDALRRRCRYQGWEHRSEDVLAWMQALCTTPLPALDGSLQQLRNTRAEMEFWLPLRGFCAKQLDELCQQHLFPSRPRPPLSARTLDGLLMGFADLVYEVGAAAPEGSPRFGVLDYKSNALGPIDASYTQAAMEDAMLQHRYDVQAALYLLALHRLLRQRLGSRYQAERDLHGAVYLFLRGVNGPQAGCLHLSPPWALLKELDERLPPGELCHGRGAD